MTIQPQAGHREANPTGSAPVLEARGITAGYGIQPVVRDVNLEVRPGEVLAILGPNGAGKTTTLLALAGELPVMSGEVFIDGKRTHAPLHRRAHAGLAFVPEERSVFRAMSCMENLRVGRSDPAKALELFPELEKRIQVRGGLLSGGEQQMLTLGRALSRNPRILLLDELSLGLAPLIVRRLLSAVRAAADAGTGVVLVEQHIRLALKFADFVLVMHRGRVALSGTAVEVRARLEEIERTYLSGPSGSVS